MKLIASISFLLLTLTAHATLAVYSQAIVKKTTGGGVVESRTIRGYFVLEMETGSVFFANVDRARGRFTFVHPDNYAIDTVSGGLDRNFTVMSFGGQYHGALVAKGRQRQVDLFANDVWGIAKTLTVDGAGMHKSGDTVFYNQYSGELVYNASETMNANTFNDTLAEAELALRQNLLNKGYTEE